MKTFRCGACDRRRPKARMFGNGPFFCLNALACDAACDRLARAFARRTLSRPEWPQHPKAWAMWKEEASG